MVLWLILPSERLRCEMPFGNTSNIITANAQTKYSIALCFHSSFRHPEHVRHVFLGELCQVVERPPW